MERHDLHDHRESGAHLSWALLLTLAFAVVELIGGLWSGSLALVSDSGHMFLDTLALGLAAFAERIARRPAGRRHSYGYARAEVIAALVNGAAMLGVILFIVVEAVRRFLAPQPVAGMGVMVIAFLGLLVNVVTAWVVSRGTATLNSRAALVHVAGDMAGSVAALAAGAIVHFTGWLAADPLLSLAIAALILFSTVNVLREALHVLMEGVPDSVQIEAVGEEIVRIPGIAAVHDLHVWNISSGEVALSAHVEVEELAGWPRTLEAVRVMLRDRFGIGHVTLQPELRDGLKQPYRARVRIFPRQ